MGGTAYDWPRTLMARGAEAQLRPDHLRRRPKEARSGALHCFLLDCSASMLKDGKLARAKGVLVELMEEAYRRRDRVALLCFGGNTVELRMPPRRAGAFNDTWLAPIAGGGGTPLTLGVQQAGILLAKHESAQRWLWLLTDGRSTESPARPVGVDVAMVVDFEGGRGALGRAQSQAKAWSGEYFQVRGPDRASSMS